MRPAVNAATSTIQTNTATQLCERAQIAPARTKAGMIITIAIPMYRGISIRFTSKAVLVRGASRLPLETYQRPCGESSGETSLQSPSSLAKVLDKHLQGAHE
jgi:hypothetical protein